VVETWWVTACFSATANRTCICSLFSADSHVTPSGWVFAGDCSGGLFVEGCGAAGSRSCWEMLSAESKSVYPAVVRENKETKCGDPSPFGDAQGQDDDFKK
jgi:hypothetical protein